AHLRLQDFQIPGQVQPDCLVGIGGLPYIAKLPEKSLNGRTISYIGQNAPLTPAPPRKFPCKGGKKSLNVRCAAKSIKPEWPAIKNDRVNEVPQKTGFENLDKAGLAAIYFY